MFGGLGIRGGLIAAITSVGALALPAAGSAAWTAPTNISGLGGEAPVVAAIDDQGDSIIAWQRLEPSGDIHIKARTRSAGGALSAIQRPSGPDGSNPQVTTDGNGDSLIVWERLANGVTSVHARALSAAGALGPVQKLTGNDASNVRVAMDGDGDAVVVWRRVGAVPRIKARARSAAGVLSPTQTISGAGGDAGSPSVAMDPTGNATVVWLRDDGGIQRVQARDRLSNGSLGPVQTLSGRGGNASDADVVISPDGVTTVYSWLRSGGTGTRVQTRAGTTGGLTEVQTVSPTGNAFEAHAAVDNDGDATFVWRRNDSISFPGETRTRSAAGALGNVQTFSGSGSPMDNAVGPQVGVDTVGNAVIAWHFFGDPGTPIQARTRSAAGALGPTDDLSGATSMPDAQVLAVNDAGDAVVAWEATGPGRVQAAFGP